VKEKSFKKYGRFLKIWSIFYSSYMMVWFLIFTALTIIIVYSSLFFVHIIWLKIVIICLLGFFYAVLLYGLVLTIKNRKKQKD
jgi:hypothetical protein